MRRLHPVTLACLLFCSLALAQERRAFTVPFHLSHGYILIGGELDAKPAVFLLDTGSPVSFCNRAKAGMERRERYSLKMRSRDLTKSVSFYRPDVAFDGIIGQDILREFSAVRIDYKHGAIEFEQLTGTRR